SRGQLEYIWVLDRDDHEGQRICQELSARYPCQNIHLVTVPPPPANESPKAFKLIEGRKRAQGDVLCVLDDDTMLPEQGLDLVLPFLDQTGVGLAFGLPYYVNFSNIWSAMVAAFVNSHSLLSYIPYTALTEPFTINGMFYVLRSEVLDAIGGFEAIKYMLADDFAIAHLCRTHGYRLAQTPLCHAISTQVRDGRHYRSLLQRWFVVPRESILYHISRRERFIFYAMAVLPTLFPFFLLLSLLLLPSRSKLCAILLYAGCNLAIIDQLNKKYLRRATPKNKTWLVLAMLFLIPVQIVIALFSPQRINWRGNIVRVERGGNFTYVQRRGQEKPL
ncbi:MAG: glycosyltransferase, partial [Ktedonobacteraceae bacterium]|nr:glycosyltransferase [Ktedonobacteraceae bacterium]